VIPSPGSFYFCFSVQPTDWLVLSISEMTYFVSSGIFNLNSIS